MKSIEIQVTDTHCASCSMLVEMTLEEVDGVDAVSCDHASGMTTVTFDEAVAAPEALVEAIKGAGYGATVVG